MSAAATLPTINRTGKVIPANPWEHASKIVLRRTMRARSSARIDDTALS
jgi:hypothetical protein